MRSPMPFSFRTPLTAALLLSTMWLAGCNDDCTVYCNRQADYLDQCLPEFGQGWDEIGGDQFDSKSTFVDACEADIDVYAAESLSDTCGEDDATSDWDNCKELVDDSVERVCAENIGQFRTSCSNYWTATTSFLPGEFDPPGDDDDSAIGDDDDSVGDDDDSAIGDDDDSVGDDDDSAIGDDDDSVGDDDDSAIGDDDDSVGDDDDSAIGDDDDSVGDDDSAVGDDDDSAAGDDDSASGDDDSAAP